MMMKEVKNMIELKDISIGYRKGRKKIPILENINASLHQGEMVCIFGENGIGKSTLIRTVSGVLDLLQGEIIINGKNLREYASSELARTISLVLTDRIFAGNLTVEELVALGRHPHTNWLGNLTPFDIEKINWAIDIAGLNGLKDRIIHELSDGQFQKTLIARSLAQDSAIIILDEPTIHLDMSNKISVLKLLKDLSVKTGKSILIATHELDLGFQIADKLWMIPDNHSLISGTPEDLILDGTINKMIHNEAVDFNLENGRFFVKNELFYECNLEGNAAQIFWTSNALKRNHWKITDNDRPVKIKVNSKGNHWQWKIEIMNDTKMVNSITELIKVLQKHVKK